MAEATPGDKYHARVLVVDDNLANLTVLADLLASEYEVQIASTGARALEIAARSPPPDVVLLDVMMPDFDGYEVMLRLGADRRTHAIPVILVSALDHPEDLHRAYAGGAVDYIVKPFLIEDVRARVRRQLELRRSAGAITPP